MLCEKGEDGKRECEHVPRSQLQQFAWRRIEVNEIALSSRPENFPEAATGGG